MWCLGFHCPTFVLQIGVFQHLCWFVVDPETSDYFLFLSGHPTSFSHSTISVFSLSLIAGYISLHRLQELALVFHVSRNNRLSLRRYSSIAPT